MRRYGLIPALRPGLAFLSSTLTSRSPPTISPLTLWTRNQEPQSSRPRPSVLKNVRRTELDLHLTDAPPPRLKKKPLLILNWARPESSWEGGRAADASRHARGFQWSAKADSHGGICFCRCCMPSRTVLAGSAPAPSTTSPLRLDVAPAEVHGVASFYGMFSLQPRPPVVAHVCDDIACLTRGADKLCAELEHKLGPAGSACAGGRAIWLRSHCLGLCERAPAALVSSAGQETTQRVLAPASAEARASL